VTLVFRPAFLLFMTFVLAWFLPSHTRGQITMGPKDVNGVCCAGDHGRAGEPTEQDKRNCAVCFWAAGLLPVVPVSFTMFYLERHHEQLARLATQFRSILLPRESLPRGPPVLA
jgi:hypothetical protein